MAVLWLCYPRWRALYAVVVGLAVVGLLGSDFHFLGDIVAGAFVGASTGWLAVLMWEAGGPARITGDEVPRSSSPGLTGRSSNDGAFK
jgi:membrane-associated phospholipid phosphatase